ncbi:MAG: wax ester/triacylglycerol synthase family O-acyltransferase [Nitriliruptorales bacterium]|nr:wax ester/triacylglycerol synthase family O-acyltransferase [Nitriliruptorales bacterium]
MERMSLQDASFLYIEDDVTPMHVGGAAIFEGPPPTHDELVARFQAKLHLAPRYRQRVHFLPANLGLPLWVDDRHFNIDYHLRRSAVPSPGGRTELNNLVARVMSQHLDRARPLWEVWVVEGLDHGRWAMVSKVHHCMVDGIAATDLMAVLFDTEVTPIPTEAPAWAPDPEPNPIELLANSVAGMVSPLQQMRLAAAGLRMPRRAAERGMELLRASLPMVSRLRLLPTSSLHGPFGPHRRWRSARIDLDDVKTVRRKLGGTVNDAVLAFIARGFRDLVAARGEQLDVVRTFVPVSVRAEEEQGTLNNRVSGVFVDLPVGLDDPIARLDDIRLQMDGLKETKGAVAGDRLVRMAGFAPPMLAAMGTRLAARLPQRLVHTAATNVPGPQIPLYFCGRLLLESTPLIPLLAGVRIVVGIFSYNGTVTFGITGDYDTAPDLEVLCSGIEDGASELLALAT